MNRYFENIKYITYLTLLMITFIISVQVLGENVEVFKIGKRHMIVVDQSFNSEIELNSYIANSKSILDSADQSLSGQAIITFRRPLSYKELESILGNSFIDEGALKFYSNMGDELFLRYPLNIDETNEFVELTPFDSTKSIFVACSGNMIYSDAYSISGLNDILCVDVGPINMLSKYEKSRIVLKTDLYNEYSKYTGAAKPNIESALPGNFVISQNYPNPFNPSTDIRFILDRKSEVVLEVYNIIGQKLVTLIDQSMEAGEHSITWDASKYSSGIYIYKLKLDNITDTKKMILLK